MQAATLTLERSGSLCKAQKKKSLAALTEGWECKTDGLARRSQRADARLPTPTGPGAGTLGYILASTEDIAGRCKVYYYSPRMLSYFAE